ncbi:hypothetical protein BU14_0333s0001 [Porphyra umbilicalis]|uniref:Uncharacterized protein n=1 Tax=Porphyra umbilicalis TaxID=2786 RepID=A0A1X6NYE8_PORUM|nr:hypothetical protein BU14_0333s0001 [Porphyra umbilicalis]|eukprot:OSX73612.1 hypothetical protein BU14_0333s0001 [Porphyra umbilicalis]
MSNSETHPPMERRFLWRWLAAVAVVAAMVGLRAHSGVAAHSTVRVPLPMVDFECTSGQGPRPCDGLGDHACPIVPQRPFPRLGEAPSRPSATWRRGETVQVTWSRNNHPPVGFVRLALVPTPVGLSVAAHARYSFWWGCWGSGQVGCGDNKRLCDDDRSSKVFRRSVRVPTSIPDGVYVLGFVWYGGALRNSEYLSIRPYWSCAYVRVRGGPGPTATFPRRFVPGVPGPGLPLPSTPDQRRRMCVSGIDRLGPCDRFQGNCSSRRLMWLRPTEWVGTRTPPPLTRRMYM